jgi:hypothetical protein
VLDAVMAALLTAVALKPLFTLWVFPDRHALIVCRPHQGRIPLRGDT